MASGCPVKELREEATCSICLDYFNDPVMIVECGHNFCRDCLSCSWGEVAAQASCPQCRGRAEPKSLRPNQQLANFVEIAKKFTLQEGKGGNAKGEVCEKHHEPPETALEDKAVVAATKGRVCQKHQEQLKLFCKDDEALICVVCDRSKDHRDHETLPLEEASPEYKGLFHNRLEILKEERERIVAYKADIEKESQDMLKQTIGEKQDMVAHFRQMHTFLEEQEKLLLAQMEEVEKEVTRNRDGILAQLSQQLSSLESLIQEMEEKCQQPAGDLLQDVRSILQRYEEKEPFENPVTFPLALKWRIWDYRDINHLLESVKKSMKDTLDSGLHLQEANVTLDPCTAHPQLIVFDDRKSVKLGEIAQALPAYLERFDQFAVVLGHERFTAGRHFWEIIVGSEGEWMVGVARKSVNRKGNITFSPEKGFWKVGKWKGGYRACIKDLYPPLTVSGEFKIIRVCLNYPAGRVAFFDADRAALIYEFSGASFSGDALLPCFWVRLKGHLQLF